jgi:acetoin utilization deacetylase AcuC-like enzyme
LAWSKERCAKKSTCFTYQLIQNKKILSGPRLKRQGPFSMNFVFIISHPSSKEHLTGPHHPEQPARCQAIDLALSKFNLKHSDNSYLARKATYNEILLCHSEAYYRIVEKEVKAAHPLGYTSLSTGDVQISPSSLDAALFAAGGVLTAIDLVIKHPGSKSFCNLRPPGHHASQSCGMGFCLFNQVAIGAKYIANYTPFKRILIVDWDLHHGNGTQDIFYEERNIFYFSMHQEAIYPYTGLVDEKGKGDGTGTTMNRPLPPLSSTKEALEALKDLESAMLSFKPEFILISSGFDAHRYDPLGNLAFDEKTYYELTSKVIAIANRYADGRIVSALEGGYHLDAIALSAVSHVQALTDS